MNEERGEDGPSDAAGSGRSGFAARLAAAVDRADSLVCIGLDPDPDRFPASLGQAGDAGEAIVRFNAAIVAATSDLVCAYKPNLGFYLAHGPAGVAVLLETRRLIPPHVPVILDCKVGDMASTAEAYARAYLDAWGFDAITASPYLGADAVAPFLARGDRGIFILAKTSNPGGADLQDLTIRGGDHDQPLYLTVADLALGWAAQTTATIGLVVGATYPVELSAIRAHAPGLPILLPGVGAQSGDVAAAVQAGIDADHAGLIVSSSRAIIYAGSGPDFAEQAREATLDLRDTVNAARRSPG